MRRFVVKSINAPSFIQFARVMLNRLSIFLAQGRQFLFIFSKNFTGKLEIIIVKALVKDGGDMEI